MEMMRTLEMKLIYILTKYEQQLKGIKQFNLYTGACQKHIEKFDTQEFIARVNLIFFEVGVVPFIQIMTWEEKSHTTLFSVTLEDDKGKFVVSIHFTKNQFMYSELRIIPGLTD